MPTNIKDNRGGARKGTGPKLGSGTSKQICVSVQKENWDTALSHWQRYRKQRKPSWLVDGLLSYYVKTKGSILETEAAI
jgi:hypothetical protein